MTQAEAAEILGRVVDAFFERHPDLHDAIMRDAYWYGGMSAETAQAVMEALEAEARE